VNLKIFEYLEIPWRYCSGEMRMGVRGWGGNAAYMQLPHTVLYLASDYVPVLPLSVPTSSAGSIITVEVGTFNRQLAVAGLR